MGRRNLAHDNLYSLEREIVSLFGKFTGRDAGAGKRAMLRVDGISSPAAYFVVGERVAGDTSNAYGSVVKAVLVSATVQLLTLDGVTGGPFQNNENLTGYAAGAGVADGIDHTVPAPLAGDAILTATMSSDVTTVPFVLNEVVTGGTSHATGVVVRVQTVSATVQQLTLAQLTDTFDVGEAITGSVLGAGTLGTLGFQFSPPAGGKAVAALLPVCGAVAGSGRYTLSLEDKWAGLLQFKPCVMDATNPDDWEVGLMAEAVATAPSTALSLVVFKGGAASDLTADDTLRLELVLSNTAILTGY